MSIRPASYLVRHDQCFYWRAYHLCGPVETSPSFEWPHGRLSGSALAGESVVMFGFRVACASEVDYPSSAATSLPPSPFFSKRRALAF